MRVLRAACKANALLAVMYVVQVEKWLMEGCVQVYVDDRWMNVSNECPACPACPACTACALRVAFGMNGSFLPKL